MDIFKKYATDAKAEQEGREFEIDGVKYLIARSGNAKYNRMLSQQYEAHKHTLDLKDTDAQLAASKDRSNKIMAYVMAHSILLGWGPGAEYDGEDFPYSIANAEKALLHEEFQKEIAKRADDFKNFRVATEKADEKNSPTSSGGTSPGELDSKASS